MNDKNSNTNGLINRASWSFYPVSSFDAYYDDWNHLNRELCDVPLLDSKFVQLLLNEFSSKNELLAICRQHNMVIACAILTKNRFGSWQTFQPSQAPLGLWVQSKKFSLNMLLESLQKSVPGFCITLGITQQDPEIIPRPVEIACLKTLDYINTAKITVQGTFEQYWATRGKNLRQNLRRQRNRLARENVSTRLEIITEPNEASKAVDEYGLLESKGWKAETGTALHPQNAQGCFYRRLIKTYCSQKEAVVYRYWYNDILVASDLCIFRNGIITILKTTHDEAQKTSSPTMLMRQEMFEHIFESKRFSKIEFYGKLMDWHTKWAEETKVLYHVNYFRWKLFAKIWKIRN